METGVLTASLLLDLDTVCNTTTGACMRMWVTVSNPSLTTLVWKPGYSILLKDGERSS